MTHDAAPSVLVVDTNIMISLIQGGQLEILGQLRGYKVVIPDEVVKEVTNADQAATLTEALNTGVLMQEPVSGIAELELFSEYISQMGRGEAACLAIATNRGCYLASTSFPK